MKIYIVQLKKEVALVTAIEEKAIDYCLDLAREHDLAQIGRTQWDFNPYLPAGDDVDLSFYPVELGKRRA